MTRRAIGRACILGAALAALPVSVSAQRTVTRSIFVEAVDSGGKPVLNLTAEDFQITENGAKRAVTRAALGSAPMRIVLLVDSSTAVGPMLNSFRTALNAFVDELPESEEDRLHFDRRAAPDSRGG